MIIHFPFLAWRNSLKWLCIQGAAKWAYCHPNGATIHFGQSEAVEATGFGTAESRRGFFQASGVESFLGVNRSVVGKRSFFVVVEIP